MSRKEFPHKGQRVICISAELNKRLEVGKTYTITKVRWYFFEMQINRHYPFWSPHGLHFAEVTTHGAVPFYAARFRPLEDEETKRKIETGMDILRGILRTVEPHRPMIEEKEDA